MTAQYIYIVFYVCYAVLCYKYQAIAISIIMMTTATPTAIKWAITVIQLVRINALYTIKKKEKKSMNLTMIQMYMHVLSVVSSFLVSSSPPPLSSPSLPLGSFACHTFYHRQIQTYTCTSGGCEPMQGDLYINAM